MKNKIWIAALALVLASAALNFYFYPALPERMASHWNIAGVPDGFMPKAWALAFLPAVSLALLGLFYVIPKIDPLGANIRKFGGRFERFALVMTAFMCYVNLLSLGWNLGWRFDMGQALLPLMAVLFYFAGDLMEHAKRNWFVGIRTPWTLSSERVWDKTHAIGGRLFKAFALVMLVGIAFPQAAFPVVIGSALAIVAWSFVYSYVEYQRELREGRRSKRRKP